MKHITLSFIIAFSCLYISTNAQTELWSTTLTGGANGSGTVYKLAPDGSNYSTIYDFPSVGLQAASPYHSTPCNGGNGKLYAMTRIGGSSGSGTIFTYDTATSVFTLIHSFGSTSDGSFPYGSLMLASDGKLYGMTSAGGLNGDGVIFKVDPATNVYTKVKDFNSFLDGRSPRGELMEASNGLFYGVTTNGGTNANGCLFSYNSSSNTISRLHSFILASGISPNGTLIQAVNGKLYGLTVQGGDSTAGTIFSFDIGTGTHSVRYSFNQGASGRLPRGKLVQHPSGLFYGLTQIGGSFLGGTLFGFDDDLSLYSVVHNFNSSSATDGGSSWGSLLLASDGKFYGTTSIGNPYGILFSCTPAGVFAKVASFNGVSNGYAPLGSLVEMGSGKLFGMTTEGGTGGFGTFFRFFISGSVFTKLNDFSDYSNGRTPNSGLFQAANGKLYGMTPNGGANLGGVLYRVSPDSGTFSKIHNFGNNMSPRGVLMQASNGLLYGMTYGGGSAGAGSLFSVDTGTNVVSTIYNLQFGTSPRLPKGGLVQANDGLLYGMSASGGANSLGALFSFNISTSAFVKLVDFDGASKGDSPEDNLYKATNGKLYGMCQFGGANDNGTLFSYDPSISTFFKILDFNNTTTGRYPLGSLMQASDGNLFGMCAGGGANGTGVIFSLNPTTNTYSVIYNFPPSTNDLLGSDPTSTFIQASNGLLYSVTRKGGINDLGVAFHFNPLTATYTKIKDFSDTIASNPLKSAFVEVNINILTGSTDSVICAGTSINVPFLCSGTMTSGNVFTAQLSNSTGSFSSPVNIGSLTSVSSGTISAVIPSNTANGNGYRIRVISSLPADTGSDNGYNISITRYQYTIFAESMGTVGGTTSIAAHESANGFDNDAFTMTGTSTDVRITAPSTGYSGATGAGNVFFNSSSGRVFEISGINTLGTSGLQLSFGIYKSTTASAIDQLVVEVSSNGSSYSSLNYSLPSGSGTNVWFYRTPTGSIPQAANLRIRFRQSYILPSNQYRIDDIKLTSEDLAPGISASGPLTFCTGNTVTLTATPASSFLWSNSAVTQAIVTGSTGNYYCTLTGDNGCVVTSDTLSVLNVAISNYNVTGGANICSGSDEEIGLDGSEIDVNYQLIKDNTTTIGSPVAGTGLSLSFGNQNTAGVYRVVASSTINACSDTMSGSAVITVILGTTYYRDFDNDGYGDPAVDSVTCLGLPSGYVGNNTDCNDNDALEFPSQTWYIDADGDDYSSGVTIVQCSRPLNGYVNSELLALSGDCNDTASSAYPGATEICNGIDDDCDFYIDEGCGVAIYCIGPSASYTPPSGPSYINQFSPFPTLTAAVTFLNTLTGTDDVIFELQSNFTGIGETFPITITYEGNASATAVFRPRSDQATQLIIATSVLSTSRMIYFNGADYVTFDGSAGGTLGADSKILLRNLVNSGTSGRNIQFVNDATHNTLNAITVEGGHSASACIEIGGTVGSNGNDNLLIQNCLIRDRSDTTLTFIPEIGIYSVSVGSANSANSNNRLLGNKIQNVSTGIRIGTTGNNGSWEIKDNHIYFTNSVTHLSLVSGIKFNTTDTASLEISGNYIGGSEPFTGGTYMHIKSGSFSGIEVSLSISSPTALVAGNKVSNILWSGSDNRFFYGINAYQGPLNIDNNIIGDPLIANSILFADTTDAIFHGIYYRSDQNSKAAYITDNLISNINLKDTLLAFGSSCNGIYYYNVNLIVDTAFISENIIKNVKYAGRGVFAGIYVIGTPDIPSFTDVSNNKIESIIVSNDYDAGFSGIYLESAPARVYGNRIGSFSVLDDILIARKGKTQGILVYPYYSNGTLTVDRDTVTNVTITQTDNTSAFAAINIDSQFSLHHVITNNQINNIKTASTMNGSSSNFSTTTALVGIYARSLRDAMPFDEINSNTVSNLHSTTTSTALPLISGLTSLNRRANIQSNKVSKLSIAASSHNPSSSMYGFYLHELEHGTISNNMIALDNNNLTTSVEIIGIYHTSGSLPTSNYFYNSVVLSGSSPLGGFSAAFFRNYINSSAPGASIRNNIFYNARITPYTTVAIDNIPVTANWNSTTSDYNLLYSSDPSSVGFWGGVVKTFSEWQTSSGGDAHSLSSTVSFVNIGDDLHIASPGNCNLDGAAINVLSVSDDIDAQIRNALTPDIGADEFSGTSTIAATGPISGPDSVCAGDNSVAYSVPLISGATDYVWTLPAGASIVTGLNSNSITVDFLISASSGAISVYGTDGICSGLSSSLPLIVSSSPISASVFSGTSGAITITDNAAANPYPSTINVAGLAGLTQDVNVTLSGFSHTWPDDVDILLESPSGQMVMLVSDCGSSTDLFSINFTLDDAASTNVPDASVIIPGSYKPTNGSSPDNFPAPGPLSYSAPTGGLSTPLSTLNGFNPNGTWKLYVFDDSGTDFGSIASWTLNLSSTGISPISGEDSVCQGQSGVSYSIPAIPFATSYSWTLPVGASITSGSNTNSITVDFSGAALSGSISVIPSNACGIGSASSAFNLIVSPNGIAGLSIVASPSGSICTGTNVTFTATPANGGTLPVYQWKKNGTVVGTNSTTYSDNGLLSGDQIECVLNGNGICISGYPANSNVITMAVNACSVSVDLKAYIQGFYIGGGSMVAVANPGSYPAICDTIQLQLRNGSAPYALVQSVSGTIGTNGMGNFTFAGTAFGNSYYLVIKHRNALETWSATPMTLGVINDYDFSTSASQAFGSNQVHVGSGVYAIWSGDINSLFAPVQDGLINLQDYTALEQAIQQILSGYVVSDLNGDGISEASDFSLMENNASIPLSVIKP